MWVYACVCARTHTHYTDVLLVCEPRSRDETPGGPEESGWTKSRHYIFVYVYKVHMYMYMLRGRMRSWTNCFFNLFSLPNKKIKTCERTPPIISNLKE